jgi:hypothetical protein
VAIACTCHNGSLRYRTVQRGQIDRIETRLLLIRHSRTASNPMVGILTVLRRCGNLTRLGITVRKLAVTNGVKTWLWSCAKREENGRSIGLDVNPGVQITVASA